MTLIFLLLLAIAGFVTVCFLADKEVTDNVIFKLPYHFTSAILFVFCILCTANSLIGNPIECMNTEFKDHIEVINTYCWNTSTYTLPHQQGQPVGSHVAASGVGPYVHGQHEVVHYNYYQWVPFMLFLQGVLFYLPHWYWKYWEGGKLKMISQGLRGFTAMGLEEILNFVNVVGNIFFVDMFVGHTFLNYGTEVIEFANRVSWDRTDPMSAIFPRMTKCLFHTYGPSGSIQVHDALCILPLNDLNEKIFIILWFWFIILSVLSGLAILYSIGVAVFPLFMGQSWKGASSSSSRGR